MKTILHIVCIVSLLLFSLSCIAQDSLYYKVIYAGGNTIVPKGENWEINTVFISAGDGYNIKIADNNFNTIYTANDTIKAPYYIAEMELLSTKQMIQYQFYINRKKISK